MVKSLPIIMASNAERTGHRIKSLQLIQQGVLITPLLIGNAYAGDPTYSFNLPAQPLSATLDSVARSSQTKLIYADATVKGLRAAPVKGKYTAQQALDITLGKSGLDYKVVDKTLITVTGKPAPAAGAPAVPPASAITLKPMTVVGEAIQDPNSPYNEAYEVINSSTATKTDTPIMEDADFNTNGYPASHERRTGHSGCRSLENVSGVYTNVGSGGLSDTFNVRGFCSFDTYRNGMRLQGALSAIGRRETANLERIEVLKGPTSLLYGRAETGGMVNMVTKQPLEEAFYAVEQKFASFDTYRTTVDATGPLNDDKTVLYRMNMAYESSDSLPRLYRGRAMGCCTSIDMESDGAG